MRAAVWLGVGALLGGLWGAAWWANRAPGSPPAGPPAPSPAGEATPVRAADSAVSRPVPAGPAAAPQWHDPLSRASDLHALAQRWRSSAVPGDRANAWRAWSSCAVFAGGGPVLPTPESLAAGFADSAAASQRLEALRLLQARCQGFAGETASDAAAMQAMHARGEARSHAEAARALLDVGEREAALRQVAEAAASGDPQEIRELSGLVERFRRDAAEGEALPSEPLRDAALALVACDLGLDCSADSLWATRLCALHGQCGGDLVERTLAGFGPLDRQALQAERDALAVQLRSGRFDLRRYVEGR